MTRARRTALVLRHDSAIGLGNLGPTLEAHGYEIVTVDAPSTDVSALDALAPDLVVVLGGDEGAYETDRYPYLADEIALLRTRIDAEAPIFGVCLGAQLLAKSLGAEVFKGTTKEVGWLTVEPTEAGASSPVRHFAGVPTVQWHGDTFELPAGVHRLASSGAYENQAFSKGEWLLAVQFHPEVTDEIHEEWLREWGDELPEYGLSREQLREERGSFGPVAQEASARLLGEYLEGLEARDTRAA
ncbi:glutamine amidotransferase-related protein [Agromyces cerinus]|uniref:GMP synthase (Glutamine-hydrolysing) n=1 Tax=Agromyces cerinus subsp. cerinus TaxID=232089 RepID=A0A1N6GL21_9MICO|nr:gamma-glutamyl-gamma-aminobutyrate hydrolase family protein [Agromyces cerinus]SIO08181.1 GMP synthase (glutamine-hydrolysing) [Agromyces cerinus subsp. cerinus]